MPSVPGRRPSWLPLLLAGALPAQLPAPADPDWAFAPPAWVEPPPADDPEWNASPLDRFVWHALRQAGIAPSPVADRRTLLRRATFVLTGLPPTPEELDAFLADGDADDRAFERVVDRLLASVHHAEHQARHWLDLARYSDSNGLDENLAFGNAWRYRDWVVRAHHDDLPYDRFVTLQLAGDLLAHDPAVGLDGYVATGFLALGPRMLAEQDKEKLLLDTVDEQLDLVGRTVLGLTLGCARCHDHKFDPISQRDYYALAGVFRSTRAFADLEHVSKWLDRELETDAALAARRAAVAARDAAAAALQQATTAELAALRAGIAADAGRYLLAGEALRREARWIEAEAAVATNLRADAETWGDAETTVLHTASPGEQFAEWRLEPRVPGRHRLLVRYAAAESRPMRVLLDGAEQQAAALAPVTGGWHPAQQRWHAATVLDLPGPATLRLVATGPHVPHLDALLLLPLPAGDAGDDGLLPPVLWQVAATLAAPPRESIVAFWRELCDDGDQGFESRVRAAADRSGLAELLLGGLPPASPRELAARLQTLFAAAAAAAPAGSSPPLADTRLEAARAHFGPRGLFAVDDDTLRPWLPAASAARLQQLAAAHDAAAAAVPPPAARALCVAEDAVRDLPVHRRGSHLALAPTTEPRGVPAVFASFGPPPTMPPDRSGRVELAHWLFAPEQALAARVHANRLWQRAFGEGLVRSPSNVGRRGDRPLHRDLLDWLAHDLRAHGWSQRHLWRRLVTSRTWRQHSTAHEAVVAADPDNRLHGRQRRFRLQAESVRDAMLACAGTLDRAVGGSLLGTADRAYVTNDQSQDAARYDAPRRSLYLPVVRNAMYDLFVAFDYADPSVHLEQRPQSTTAPQALWLLNAPLVRQQSRALAAAAAAAAADDDGRIDFLWRAALQRLPSAGERQAAHAWLAGAGADAWTDLAQTLFACNEFLHVD